jgi:hypothetical protein
MSSKHLPRTKIKPAVIWECTSSLDVAEEAVDFVGAKTSS